MIRKLLGLKLPLLFLVVSAPVWGQSSVDVKQFAQDAVRSWKSFDTEFRTSICGKITIRQKTEPEAKGPFEIPKVQTVELRAKGKNAVVIFPDVHNPNNQMVIGQNSKYGFRLSRRDSEKPWEIRSVHSPGTDVEDPAVFDPVTGLCGIDYRSPLAVSNLLLSDILSRDDIVFDSWEKTPDGLVEVTYSFDWPADIEDKPMRIALVSGSIKVDPEHAFRPVAVGYTFATKVPTYLIEGSTKFYYESADANCPLPTRSESEVVQSGVSNGIWESTYDWSFSGGELSHESFTLTNFGLTEPPRFVEIE